MKRYWTIGCNVVLALTALTVQLDAGVDAHALPADIGRHAGTWEDDCNLSKRHALTFAAQPGSVKSASWTRTTIGYHDRGCRQVAAVDAARSVVAS